MQFLNNYRCIRDAFVVLHMLDMFHIQRCTHRALDLDSVPVAELKLVIVVLLFHNKTDIHAAFIYKSLKRICRRHALQHSASLPEKLPVKLPSVFRTIKVYTRKGMCAFVCVGV